jgi:hypothetical protein
VTRASTTTSLSPAEATAVDVVQHALSGIPRDTALHILDTAAFWFNLRQRKPRKPTLTSVAAQASKAAIAVARYEVKPDGTVVVVTGAPAAGDINPWDEVLINAADAKRPS